MKFTKSNTTDEAAAAKGTPPATPENDSIDSLKVKYEEVKNKIRKILNGRNDKKDIRDEEKRELRTHYSHAAQIAFTLSQRCVSQEDIDRYADESRKLAARAKEYGSVMHYLHFCFRRVIIPSRLVRMGENLSLRAGSSSIRLHRVSLSIIR